MEKTVINYQINYDNPRMRGDILSDEMSFSSVAEAEAYWNHLSIKDKNAMPNAFIEQVEEKWDDDDLIDAFCSTVKYLYLSSADERLINQMRKVIDKVECEGYSEERYPKPSDIREIIDHSEEYTIYDYLDNGHDIIWYRDVLEERKPDVAYDCIEDRFLTEEEMKHLPQD